MLSNIILSSYYYLCLLKGIRSGLERVFPPKGGCNPVVGLQCAARIGGKNLKKGHNSKAHEVLDSWKVILLKLLYD